MILKLIILKMVGFSFLLSVFLYNFNLSFKFSFWPYYPFKIDSKIIFHAADSWILLELRWYLDDGLMIWCIFQFPLKVSLIYKLHIFLKSSIYKSPKWDWY